VNDSVLLCLNVLHCETSHAGSYAQVVLLNNSNHTGLQYEALQVLINDIHSADQKNYMFALERR
jgi:hypothetical protein